MPSTGLTFSRRHSGLASTLAITLPARVQQENKLSLPNCERPAGPAKKSPKHRIRHLLIVSSTFRNGPMVASSNLPVPFPSNPRPLDLDQVEDLLKLQRAAQKINSIL